METEFVCPIHKEVLLIDKDNRLNCTKCSKSEFKLTNNIYCFNDDKAWDALYLGDPSATGLDAETYKSEEPFKLNPKDDVYRGLIESPNDKEKGVYLDLGCGDGVFSSNMTNKVYCCDVTMEGLNRLRRRGNINQIPVLCSGQSLPFRNNYFDGILFIYVIEHLSKKCSVEILKEIRRVIKTNSNFIYTTDTPFFDRHLVRWTSLVLKGKIKKQDHETETGHINLLTIDESIKLIKSCGFNIKELKIIRIGERYNILKKIHNILQRILPKNIYFNYLTSSYTITASKK